MYYLRSLCLFACGVFLRIVCPVMSVSLYCPFLITSSVFSNIYLISMGQQAMYI
jgi:hypothetical protein